MRGRATPLIVLLMCVALLLVAVPVFGAPDDDGSGLTSSAVSMVGPAVRLSDPVDYDPGRSQADIAYDWNHREYLVVWVRNWPGGHREICGRRVSASGERLSWFVVSAGVGDRISPAVAYNATEKEYLVTWMQNVNGDFRTYEIWGRRIA